MKIDHILEFEVLQELLAKLPDVDPIDTAVLNVSPDYSSTVSMHVAHHLSKDGRMLDIVPVDVPYPSEDVQQYKDTFSKMVPTLKSQYNKLILCEAAVLSGKNYTWLTDILQSVGGYGLEDITTVALFERDNSIYKSSFVGRYCDSMPDFYFERYNLNWD